MVQGVRDAGEMEDGMTESDAKAQEIADDMRTIVAANASHNLRAALADEQRRCKRYQIGFWIALAALVAVMVGRM